MVYKVSRFVLFFNIIPSIVGKILANMIIFCSSINLLVTVPKMGICSRVQYFVFYDEQKHNLVEIDKREMFGSSDLIECMCVHALIVCLIYNIWGFPRGDSLSKTFHGN